MGRKNNKIIGGIGGAIVLYKTLWGNQSQTKGTISSNNELATYLTSIGAKVYTACWCGACNHQKALFGTDAVLSLNIIECSYKCPKVQASLCSKITAYPTWQINNKLVKPGVMSLNNLASMSKYTGNRNWS
jgi:hypothetical protein